MPPNTGKVDRSSRWGNPFVIGQITDEAQLGKGTPKKLSGVPVADRAQAVEMFGDWIHSRSERAKEWRASVHLLAGRNLACWCPLDGPCHADVLLKLANA